VSLAFIHKSFPYIYCTPSNGHSWTDILFNIRTSRCILGFDILHERTLFCLLAEGGQRAGRVFSLWSQSGGKLSIKENI
jgi:hypothetical protein